MYSLDGVPLQNPAYGWRLKRASEPYTQLTQDIADFNSSNRDGTIDVRGRLTTPTLTLVVTAPQATLSALLGLMRAGTTLARTADPSKTASVDMVSMQTDTLTPAGGGLYQVTAAYRIPGVFWRDASSTDQVCAFGQSSNTGFQFTVLTASTAPVRDAVLSVKGPISSVVLAGANSTYIQYAHAVASGHYLVVNAISGRAWDGTDPWSVTGATEVSGDIASGAYPYFLELAPNTNPGIDGALLAVSWAGATAGTSQVTVRAKNAYHL